MPRVLLQDVIAILREWREADHALRQAQTHDDTVQALTRLRHATDAVREWIDRI